MRQSNGVQRTLIDSVEVYKSSQEIGGVSTGTGLQEYNSQVDYYTRYIQGRGDWEFVSVYTDAEVIIGLTGKTLALQWIAAFSIFTQWVKR